MKQRQLTEIQLTVISMDREGRSDHEIAAKLGIHVGTVRLKRAAIRRGVAKNAYSNYSEDTRQKILLFDMETLS